jgi:3-hydroxybutyryl-CoA dehydrogenase
VEISSFGVVGAGQMGNGIAHVAALAGLEVVVQDVNSAALERARDNIRNNLDRQLKKGQITQADRDGALNRLLFTTDLRGFSGVPFIVEAATEKEALKFEIFTRLSEIVGDGAILASNTSSISITAIGARTQRPDKVIGMHFMNPVPVMKLVEVIPGLATNDETLQTTLALAARLGKTTVVSKDMPGFIVNRVLMPYINEAFYALHEGIATAKDIDEAMKLGTNVPMGPLTLADFIGLDTCLSIMEVLHSGMGGDSKYRPCPLLKKYVEAGWLGRKSGRGVYPYTA